MLVHFSKLPVLRVENRDQAKNRRNDKPIGLWVSDESTQDSWRAWCESEQFGLGRLACVHDVTLAADARIMRLSSSLDIDAFTDQYGMRDPQWGECRTIDWQRLATTHQGILITPYCWSRRLDGGADWYYGWDCASGCIWDASAIASITLREPVAGLQAAE